MSWQHLVFVAAGLIAFAVVAWEMRRKRAVIIELLLGRPVLPEQEGAPEADRWRRVHIDGDRERPFEVYGRRIGR